MSFTEKYTIENWRTDGDPVVRDIPREAKSITLEEAYRKLGSGDQNIVEMVLQYVFDAEGWTVERMPLNQRNWIDNIFKYCVTEKFDSISWEALSSREGVPDFLLLDMENKEYKFVEVKASEDGLNEAQIKWAEEHTGCELYVAQLAPVGALQNPTEEDIVEANRLDG